MGKRHRMRDVVSILSECSDSISIGSICTYVFEKDVLGLASVEAIKKPNLQGGFVHMPAQALGKIENDDRVKVLNIKDGIATVVKCK